MTHIIHIYIWVFQNWWEKKRKKKQVGLIVGLTLLIKKFGFSDLVKKSKKITKIMRVWTPKLNYEIIFTFPDKNENGGKHTVYEA